MRATAMTGKHPTHAKRVVLALAATAAGAVPAAPVAAGEPSRSCGKILNPYPETRYDGVDLTAIRASGVSCATARTVARRAHAKALRLAPPESGVRRFAWNGWTVRGDLRGSSDRYTATRSGDRVTWRF